MTNQILGQRFLFKWIQACALSGTLSLVLGCIIFIIINDILRIPIGGAIILLTIGIAVGIAQYRVLKPHLTGTRRWFFGTVIGTAVAIAIFNFVRFTFSSEQLTNVILNCAVPFILIGAVAGFLQYCLLYKQLEGAISYALISTFSVVIAEVSCLIVVWILTTALYAFLLLIGGGIPDCDQGLSCFGHGFALILVLILVSPVGIYAGFAVYGAITGSVLVKLLRQGGVTERN